MTIDPVSVFLIGVGAIALSWLMALAASIGWHKGKMDHFKRIWDMTNEEPSNGNEK